MIGNAELQPHPSRPLRQRGFSRADNTFKWLVRETPYPGSPGPQTTARCFTGLQTLALMNQIERGKPGNGQVVRSCKRGYALVHVLENTNLLD